MSQMQSLSPLTIHYKSWPRPLLARLPRCHPTLLLQRMPLGPIKNSSSGSPERVGQEDKTLDPIGMVDTGQL